MLIYDLRFADLAQITMKKQKNMNAGLKSMKNKGIFQFQFTEIKEYG